ncbi:hypothetical protein KPL74_06275 [Bacillus sp. NP157]|nr:hypothetical protein KPL74_06275 [Bacillus sp. NP157]
MIRILSSIAFALAMLWAPKATPADDAGAGPIDAEEYVHQSWTMRDGAPPAICAIAQGPDGYLWLGTGLGLYRFDGIEFSRYQPASGQHLVAKNITALLFSREGGLWIGSYEGGATYLKDGRLQSWTTRDGMPPGWVNTFAEGPDGETWVATGRGLGRFEAGHWQQVGSDWGYDGQAADWAAFDRQGTLWVATGSRLVYLPLHARQFQVTQVLLSPAASIAVAPDGTIWVTDRIHGTRVVDVTRVGGPAANEPTPAASQRIHAASRMAFDPAGGLWATAVDNASVFHVQRDGRPAPGASVGDAAIADVFPSPLLLSSNTAIPVAVDHEGTIWVGTGVGIDSYHRSPIGQLRDARLDTTHLGMAVDAEGHLWVSSANSVFALRGNALVPIAAGLPDTIGSLAFDHAGVLWIIGYHDLFRMRDGAPEKLALPNQSLASRINFVAPGVGGALWASIEGLGIYRLDGNRWSSWTPRTRGLETSPTTGWIDTDGAMWFGYADGTILHVDRAGNEFAYHFPPGNEIGTVTSIGKGAAGLLIGGTAGIASLANGQLYSITDKTLPLLSGITGMIQEDNGDTWLNTGRGIVRYTHAELARAFTDPTYRPEAQGFDFRDGILGSARQGKPVGTMQRDAEGRLWFLTNENLYWFKPPWRRDNLGPPPVHVKAVIADGRRIEPGEGVTLQAGTTSLQVDYTALSFASPTRLRFRYMLEGEDSTWVEARSRRQAYYTNLGPGHYTFRVMASNDQGLWSEREAKIGIVIPPRFYQAWWFHAGIAVLLALAVALVYARHVRHVTRTIRLQADARHEERERIARELHDTLLQAIYGIVLKFQAIVAAIPDGDPLKKSMRGTLKIASDFIVEGRNRVRDLRMRLLTTSALGDAVVDLLESLRDAESVVFESQVAVVDQPIDPATAEEILAICRESLVNAVRHAKASRIDVSLRSTREGIFLTVSDDGVGIDPEALATTHAGKWGIAGMRERAMRVGGDLSIHSVPGKTCIELVAPLRPAPPHARHRPASR